MAMLIFYYSTSMSSSLSKVFINWIATWQRPKPASKKGAKRMPGMYLCIGIYKLMCSFLTSKYSISNINIAHALHNFTKIN